MERNINRAPIFLREPAIIKPCLAVLFWLNLISAAALHAATMAEVTANLAKLNAQQKRNSLVKGAQAEREPKLGPKLNDYLKEFRQIMGIQ